MEFVLFAAGFILGFYLGAKFMTLFERKIIKEALEELGISTEQLEQATKRMKAQQPDDQGILELEVNIEKHGDQFYLYRKDTDEFIVQGRSFDEIRPVLLQRFGSVRLVADRSGSGDLLDQLAK